MQTIQLITVGACKEPYLRDACREYEKRLTRFCQFHTVELLPEKLSQNPSQKEIATALQREGVQIQKHLRGDCVALCIEGKQLDSVAFADRIRAAADNFDGGAMSFIIGSSYGLSDEIKKSANFRLSMSHMTFPHQLARVMLLEQIYRGYQILSDAKYHK